MDELKDAYWCFQPIVDLECNLITKNEMLFRSPLLVTDGVEHFIKSLEKNRSISTLDRWMLIKAIWIINTTSRFKISVNISAFSVQCSGFQEWVNGALSCLTLPGRLTIEITETVKIEKLKEAKSFIMIARSYGCEVALDDFGSGYSEYDLLEEIECNIIKIDKSLIQSVSHNKYSKIRVEEIVSYAFANNIEVIAEGIFSYQNMRDIRSLGIRLGQSHFISRPSRELRYFV